jgi:hypothetical protein
VSENLFAGGEGGFELVGVSTPAAMAAAASSSSFHWPVPSGVIHRSSCQSVVRIWLPRRRFGASKFMYQPANSPWEVQK